MREALYPAHRPDIDGLRGVAVCLVVAFHLRTILSHGGFIGVDIFFVISGFLITSILIRDLDNARYTITTFYVRRIRRIAPALIAMYMATSVGAYFILWPAELEQYAVSLLSSIFVVSNLYFWSHSGYFDAQASNAPLLHTWSLGVEEQFYIIFPVLLAYLHRRFKQRIVPVLAFLALISFVISAWTAYTNPNFAFYWPISRAWELLCGSLLALKRIPGMQYRVRRNLTAIGGVLLILSGVAKYFYYTTFPGITALAPCIGAVLIIGSGSAGQTVVSKILSSRPLVFLGLISYSLYLWHWPLILCESMGLAFKSESKVLQQAATFGITLLIAMLSWRFVERPFRHSRASIDPSRVFRMAALCASAPAAAACAFLLLKGAPARFSPTAVTVASYLDHSDTQRRYRTGSCFLTNNLTLVSFDRTHCLRESTNQPNILIFGDSHAAHLDSGLSTVFPNANFMQATAASCTPISKRSAREMKPPPDCISLVDFILHNTCQVRTSNS